MKLSNNARRVLAERYLSKDNRGKLIEKPEGLFKRVAKNISLADAKYKFKQQVAGIQKKYYEEFFQIVEREEFKSLIKNDEEIKNTEKDFFRMMNSLDFLPNSPTLFNAGKKLQQLAACFVLPVEDDMDSIFQALRQMAVIHKSGGGTGFSFSRLRPRGDLISSTQGRASGPISFMKIFDSATEQIRQGGKRRGANMAVLRVDHPDIEEFTTLKMQEGALQNFNLSVAVTDNFMKAAKRNKKYRLINPRNGKAVGSKKAREIFQLIVKSAWRSADPGIIFLDTINRNQPTPKLGTIESTNPCGEVPLLPYEACNLGSINVANFVKEGKINYGRLKEVTWKAVHFLDNVIDMSNYPFPEIMDAVYGNRKIGLGIMGFADLLVKSRVSYASNDAVKIAEKIMKFINEEAKKASVALGEKRGLFPNFKGSIYDTGRKEDRVRNATRTAIAPAGSISIIAGCSSGIEPLFALSFIHKLGDGKEIVSVNEYFVESARARELPEEAITRIIAKGCLGEADKVPQDLKSVFAVAHQVPAELQVRMQAAFQKHADNAVSKTVNLPAKATVKDVEKVLVLAYRLGCKGVSVYRYGSKKDQVFTVGKVCLECK